MSLPWDINSKVLLSLPCDINSKVLLSLPCDINSKVLLSLPCDINSKVLLSLPWDINSSVAVTAMRHKQQSVAVTAMRHKQQSVAVTAMRHKQQSVAVTKSGLYANQFAHKVGNESWTRPTFMVGSSLAGVPPCAKLVCIKTAQPSFLSSASPLHCTCLGQVHNVSDTQLTVLCNHSICQAQHAAEHWFLIL